MNKQMCNELKLKHKKIFLLDYLAEKYILVLINWIFWILLLISCYKYSYLSERSVCVLKINFII